MGATFNSFVLMPGDVASVEKAYRHTQDRERIQYGTDPYSGTFAPKSGGVICHTDRIFPNEREAAEWIMDRNDKWGAADAVRFVDGGKAAAVPKRIAVLEERAAAFRKELAGQPAQLVARAQAVKAKTRGCGACGSSVAVAWIGKAGRDHYGHASAACPICGDAGFLMTETDRRWGARMTAKLVELEAQIKAERQALDSERLKVSDPSKLPWLVGGWCPC